MRIWLSILLGLFGTIGWAIGILASLYPDEARKLISTVVSGVEGTRLDPLGAKYSVAITVIAAVLTFLSGYTFRSWYGRRRLTVFIEESNNPASTQSSNDTVKNDIEAHRPDYAQWDKSETYNLWNAAHLWASLEPGFYPDHPGGPPPFYAIFSELKQAVNIGRIRAEGLIYADPVQLPPGAVPAANRHTIVSRDELRRYAVHVRNERPKFLFPDARIGEHNAEAEKEAITIEKLSIQFKNGLDLNNKWRDNQDWSAAWNDWNATLTSLYRSVSEVLAITKEINVPQAIRKYAMAGVDGLSQPVIDRAMLAERLDGLKSYLESKIKQ